MTNVSPIRLHVSVNLASAIVDLVAVRLLHVLHLITAFPTRVCISKRTYYGIFFRITRCPRLSSSDNSCIHVPPAFKADFA